MPESSNWASLMLTISPSIRLAKSQDGGVLLDVEQGTMFSLNLVGARVIELLQEGHDPSSLADTIASEFHASPKTVEGDIGTFLASLGEQRLLIDGGANDRSEQGGSQ